MKSDVLLVALPAFSLQIFRQVMVALNLLNPLLRPVRHFMPPALLPVPTHSPDHLQHFPSKTNSSFSMKQMSNQRFCLEEALDRYSKDMTVVLSSQQDGIRLQPVWRAIAENYLPRPRAPSWPLREAWQNLLHRVFESIVLRPVG